MLKTNKPFGRTALVIVSLLIILALTFIGYNRYVGYKHRQARMPFIIEIMKEHRDIVLPVLLLEHRSLTYSEALDLCDQALKELIALEDRVRQDPSLGLVYRGILTKYIGGAHNAVLAKSSVYLEMVDMLEAWDDYSKTPTIPEIATDAAMELGEVVLYHEDKYVLWVNAEDMVYEIKGVPDYLQVARANFGTLDYLRESEVFVLAHKIINAAAGR